MDLLEADDGVFISKRELFDLIRLSKVEGSDHWHGKELLIANTPQQGINWVGEFPVLAGVILKVRPGSYSGDGWVGTDKERYRYSLKARKGIVSLTEKANRSLINQPQYSYPIVLLSDRKAFWRFEGVFEVSEIGSDSVELRRKAIGGDTVNEKFETYFVEGGKRYVTHLISERSKEVVSLLKSSERFECEICNLDFREKYKVDYIEAHHKVPVSTFASGTKVTVDDFALLCANCHSVVHVHMRNSSDAYPDIKRKIQKAIGSDTPK
ncbi:HNH endonuclease [Pseudomonas sp. IAC-BECa141]|uniref:HNH endonuclease n=1 Tax=Pseudomonas sp. IAC-BECa141 TaxID=2793103 RepID=UPI001D091344|nr:HNH endonuclease [Pseudomonas sp. IAC-BECa141]UDI95286.1 HNH endonuclease [Pseudomonas sp. IAC-BECa141]